MPTGILAFLADVTNNVNVREQFDVDPQAVMTRYTLPAASQNAILEAGAAGLEQAERLQPIGQLVLEELAGALEVTW
jgi:hypothetical protein